MANQRTDIEIRVLRTLRRRQEEGHTYTVLGEIVRGTGARIRDVGQACAVLDDLGYLDTIQRPMDDMRYFITEEGTSILQEMDLKKKKRFPF